MRGVVWMVVRLVLLDGSLGGHGWSGGEWVGPTKVVVVLEQNYKMICVSVSLCVSACVSVCLGVCL